VFGEDDDAGVGLLEAGVDARDDVVGRGDFPLIEPDVDAFGTQGGGEGKDGGFIGGGVADEDAHVGTA
jgi:hypothetical protein